MAFVNYSSREINVKIVYYGPGLSGKTANLQYLYAKAPGQTKGRLISLATETERTLFFDFLPMNLGSLRGFQVRFHLYTVPGQVFYEASRKLILKGVDGVVFVADSDPLRLDATVEAYASLHRNLADYGLSVPPLPLVLQYNKRDIEDALPVRDIYRALGSPPQTPQYESVATQGTGVFASLKTLAREVLKSLRDQQASDSPETGAIASAGNSRSSRSASSDAGAGGNGTKPDLSSRPMNNEPPQTDRSPPLETEPARRSGGVQGPLKVEERNAPHPAQDSEDGPRQ